MSNKLLIRVLSVPANLITYASHMRTGSFSNRSCNFQRSARHTFPITVVFQPETVFSLQATGACDGEEGKKEQAGKVEFPRTERGSAVKVAEEDTKLPNVTYVPMKRSI